MSERITLAGALRRAAVELDRHHPPPALRDHVLQAAARHAATTAATSAASPRTSANGLGGTRWNWAGGLVCATVLVGSVVLMLRHAAQERPMDDVRASRFLPLVPADRWPREASQAWLVSTEMPRERLASLGLPFDPARTGGSVRAELLVRPTGEVLAVRFLR